MPPIIKLIICQMALNSVPTSTIDFFKLIYPDPTGLENGVNTQQMAIRNSMTRVAATTHRERLVREGVLTRLNYQKWVLNRECIKDPLLQALLPAVGRGI